MVNVDYIQNGEKVNAPVTNRPIAQLASVVGQLQNKVAGVTQSAARLILSGAPLDPSVSQWDFVYWDEVTGTYKKAIAALENSGSQNTYLAAKTSFVEGFVVARGTSTGDLLLSGYYPLPVGVAASLMDAATIFVAGKTYYLSRKNFGKVAVIPGIVSVLLGTIGNDFINLNRVMKDLAESHLHFKLTPTSQPIGTSVDNGDTTRSIGGFDAQVSPNIAKLVAADGAHGGFWNYTNYVDYRFTITQLVPITEMMVEKKDQFDVGFSTLLSNVPVPSAFLSIDTLGLRVKFTNTSSLVIGQQWTIRGPRDIMGWAPVDPIADPSAPAGAKFRYSVETDSSMVGFFPVVGANLPVVVLNGTELQPNITYQFTPTSIYWMTNKIGNEPWPVDWVAWDNPGAPETQVFLGLYLTRFSAGTEGVVTTLRTQSPLKLTDCNTGLPATTGDLLLQLIQSTLIQIDPPLAGDLCVKGYTPDGTKLWAGPVVEKLIIGPGLAATSTRPGTGGIHQGTVTLQLASLEQFSGSISDITLQNAKQIIRGLTSVTLLDPPPVKTGFLGKIRVSTAANDPSRITVKMVLVGDLDNATVGDQTVRFKFSWVSIQDDPGAVIPVVPPNVQMLDFVIPAGYTAWALSDKSIVPVGFTGTWIIDLPVTPGDLFCLRIDRDVPASGTPYAGNVGFAALDFLIF